MSVNRVVLLRDLHQGQCDLDAMTDEEQLLIVRAHVYLVRREQAQLNELRSRGRGPSTMGAARTQSTPLEVVAMTANMKPYPGKVHVCKSPQ